MAEVNYAPNSFCWLPSNYELLVNAVFMPTKQAKAETNLMGGGADYVKMRKTQPN